jgi:hypothetical protein
MSSSALIISVFLAFIAGMQMIISYQQMKINERKLNLDLYNKRFSVYTDTLRFYQELSDKVDNKETHRAFIVSKQASKFLFSKDPSIFEILGSMQEESFKIIGRLRDGNEHSETPGYDKSYDKTISFFEKQISELTNKMAPYLNQ